MALILSAMLMLLAAMLLAIVALRNAASRRALAYRMGSGVPRQSALASFGHQTMGRWRWEIDPEIPALLNQLGWRRPARRAVFFALQLGVPIVAVLVAGVLLLRDGSQGQTAVILLFTAGLAFLVPKRLLVAAVGRRQERMAREVSTLLPLLRMLFDVGMTVEQALRVLVKEGDIILPELCDELRLVLARVDAGLELAQEMRQMAVLLDVDEVTDCVTILEQLIRQGGGAMASLLTLKALLDDRRTTTLQEKVSKLSAKMSAVMVACLFPALLIILAGPGFVAIFRALGEMSG